MKKHILVLLAVVAVSELVHAQSCGAPSKYYSLWQGVRAPTVSAADFNNQLAKHVLDSATLFKDKGLNNYLVGLPAAKKPAVVPDEFALVGFDQETAFEDIFKTPAGQDYAAGVGALFDLSKSKSAKAVDFDLNQTTLESNVAYNVLGGSADWCSGVRIFYVGTRKPSVTVETFKSGMAAHLKSMREHFGSQGLNAYLVLVTDDYEVAYMQFSDEATVKKLFFSAEGKAVTKEANVLMDDLTVINTDNFKNKVANGKFYSVFDSKK